MDENTSLMNKNVNDLTVGDALKINLTIMAVAVAIPVAITGGVAAKEKFDAWRMNRKMKKFEQTELEN